MLVTAAKFRLSFPSRTGFWGCPRSSILAILIATMSNSKTAVPLLTPPEHFGIVEKGLYRSEMFQQSHFTFIKQLNLKTVVVLSPEQPNRHTLTFLEECGTKLVHLGLATWKPTQPSTWRPVSEELIKEGLEMILDAEAQPLLVMCTSGIHETGIMIGCFRKLQNWNFSSIVNEYRSFAGTKSRHVNEQFIELFDLDLVTLPYNLPAWLVEQQKMLAQEQAEYDQTAITAPDQ